MLSAQQNLRSEQLINTTRILVVYVLNPYLVFWANILASRRPSICSTRWMYAIASQHC